MKRSIALTVLAALVISVGGMATVRAQDTTNHYNIQIWNDITHDYPVTGSMDLTYHANGIVKGFYHPAGLPSFIPITGGRTGDHIWLTIGWHGSWQLNGHLRDGKIVGAATNESPGSTTPYSFVATPG